MENSKLEHVTELITTITEARDYLKNADNEDVRNSLKEGRAYVTRLIEEEIGCSLEQRMHITALSDDEWLLSIWSVLRETIDPFRPQNAYDMEFKQMIDDIWKNTEEDLLSEMKNTFLAVRSIAKADCDSLIGYFAKFPLWGTLDPDNGDWTSFRLRAEVLKRHSYDFLWLYRKLEDYSSKRTLSAILQNWKDFDTQSVLKVKSIFRDYFEPDIFKNNAGDVFADVGAYIGDSVEDYVRTYGIGYKKIYAYEISSDSCGKIHEMVTDLRLHDVEVRQKGIGGTHGEMFLGESTSDASANQLKSEGNEKIEVVTLDEDAPDVTFIKMDIEGAEREALRGSRIIISKNHPKLAVCVYHGYEDLWMLPAMINEMNPKYHFYLRHYGGNNPPTEFVLLCKA